MISPEDYLYIKYLHVVFLVLYVELLDHYSHFVICLSGELKEVLIIVISKRKAIYGNWKTNLKTDESLTFLIKNCEHPDN